MCAEFMIRASDQKIRAGLGLPPGRDDQDEVDWNLHARLYSKAPVVVREANAAVIKKMGFSLKPKGTPFPTFNTRLLSWDEKKGLIVPFFEKPTWRGPLREHRCLVPISGFIEPIYSGEHGGQMVQFKPRSGEILYGAGLFADEIDKETGEVYEGFSLMIHTPSDFVLKIGHHRQPLFLTPETAKEWIQPQKIEPEWAVEFLTENRYMPDLEAETVRLMARGWEKRVAESEKKHRSELQFIERLKESRH